MKYTKQPLSFDEQVNLLRGRGLTVEDTDRARNYLSNISYYRLSAYMLPFQYKDESAEHKFRAGTTFDDVLDLYLFDRELRLLVFDVIERLEIAFRAQLIYCYSTVHDAWWFEDPLHYTNNFFYSKNLARIDEEIERSGEVFIDHFKIKYDAAQRPPAWMTFEVVSMGLLSKLYRNLSMSDSKKAIARHFHLPTPYILESWMQSITYVRNVCAHHSRLWNRVLTLKPQLPKNTRNPFLGNRDINPNKLYAFLSCCLYLLKVINPKTNFGTHFRQLLKTYPTVNLKAMGFPENWEQEVLWQ